MPLYSTITLRYATLNPCGLAAQPAGSGLLRSDRLNAPDGTIAQSQRADTRYRYALVRAGDAAPVSTQSEHRAVAARKRQPPSPDSPADRPTGIRRSHTVGVGKSEKRYASLSMGDHLDHSDGCFYRCFRKKRLSNRIRGKVSGRLSVATGE